MIRQPPIFPLPGTLFPSTTLFRSRPRPLPRRDMRMVEGVDEGQAAYGFKLPCMRISVVELLAEQDDRRAVARCLRYLHLRRRLWHHDRPRPSESLAVIVLTLRMIDRKSTRLNSLH